MSLYLWAVGDRITADRLNRGYNLFKNVAGGEDSITLSSLSAFDASRIPSSSFLLPADIVISSQIADAAINSSKLGSSAVTSAKIATGAVNAAKLSPTWESTWAATSGSISTNYTSAWTTVLSLTSMSSGVWVVDAQVYVLAKTSNAAVQARLVDANSDQVRTGYGKTLGGGVTELWNLHWVGQTTGTSGVRLQLSADNSASWETSLAGGSSMMTYISAYRIG